MWEQPPSAVRSSEARSVFHATRHRAPTYFSSFIFLQTSVVCPVLESIRVVTARQLHVTVLAFSCLTTTQCSTVSAVSGGARLRIGGGIGPAVTGFFGPHPDRIRQAPIRQATIKPATRETPSPAVLMPSVFALSRPLVDGNLDYRPSYTLVGHHAVSVVLRKRIIERPSLFTLSVDMDHQRARESGQFSSAGIGCNRHAQDSRGGGVAFHHGDAVREAKLPCQPLSLPVMRSRAT